MGQALNHQKRQEISLRSRPLSRVSNIVRSAAIFFIAVLGFDDGFGDSLPDVDCDVLSPSDKPFGNRRTQWGSIPIA